MKNDLPLACIFGSFDRYKLQINLTFCGREHIVYTAIVTDSHNVKLHHAILFLPQMTEY